MLKMLKFDSVKEEFLRLYGDPATKTTFFEKFLQLNVRTANLLGISVNVWRIILVKRFRKTAVIKSRFSKGLSERIADNVEIRNPKTLKEALTVAIEIEQRCAGKFKSIF
jgi:hypothetical protein